MEALDEKAGLGLPKGKRLMDASTWTQSDRAWRAHLLLRLLEALLADDYAAAVISVV
jgi:hypothetical protein